MARVYNFSAGPSMLPESVLAKAAAEMLDYEGSGQSVMEMSHRSKVYEGIKKAGLDASGTGDAKAVEDALKNLAADGKAVADQLGGLDQLKEAAKNMSAEEMQAAAQAAAAQIKGNVPKDRGFSIPC